MNEIANNLLLKKAWINFISTRKKRQNKLFLKIKRQPDTPPHYVYIKKYNKYVYLGAAIT